MLERLFKKRKISVRMREYLISEVREDGRTFELWIRAKNEDEALRTYRWLTDSVGDYSVVASKESAID